ncbi:hypothetical protein D3C86_1845670 [compost metagenome]
MEIGKVFNSFFVKYKSFRLVRFPIFSGKFLILLRSKESNSRFFKLTIDLGILERDLLSIILSDFRFCKLPIDSGSFFNFGLDAIIRISRFTNLSIDSGISTIFSSSESDNLVTFKDSLNASSKDP